MCLLYDFIITIIIIYCFIRSYFHQSSRRRKREFLVFYFFVQRFKTFFYLNKYFFFQFNFVITTRLHIYIYIYIYKESEETLFGKEKFVMPITILIHRSIMLLLCKDLKAKLNTPAFRSVVYKVAYFNQHIFFIYIYIFEYI